MNSRYSNSYAFHPSSGRSLFRKLRNQDLLLGLIFFLLFMWSNGFSLRVFDLSDRFRLLQLIGMFTIVGLSAAVIMFRGWRVAYSNFYIYVVFGIIFCAVLPTFIYLVIFNGLSPLEVFRVTLLYPGLFIMIILISFRTQPEFVERIARLLVVTVTIYVAFLLLISRSPELADSLLQKTSERFELTRITLRYGLTVAGAFAFYYYLVKIFAKSELRKWIYISILLLFLIFHLTTALGRRDFLSILIVVTYYWLFHVSNIKRIFGIFITLTLILAFIFLPQLETAKNSFAKILFLTSEEYEFKEGTIGKRIEGIKFNFQIFRDAGYMGIGIRSDRLPLTDPYFYGREIYRYHAGDHGLFAVIYRFGPLGILFTIIVLVRIFKDLNIILKYGTRSQQQIAMAIHLVLVGELVGFNHLFWNPAHSYVYGLLFYMIWRMRKDVYEIWHAQQVNRLALNA